MTQPPQRIVSLVPSLTESLFDLGFGRSLVGITDYCIHPAAGVAALPRLGGPKNPRLEEILALQPDLVLANWEENTRQTVEALEAAGVPVWVSFPKNVDQSLQVLRELVGLFRSPEATMRLRTLEQALEWARLAAAGRPPLRYFCPIWFDRTSAGEVWWMTFNQDTYCSDLLAVFGGENVFAHRQRRYPLDADLGREPAQDRGERDTRYPRVTLEEVRSAAPEIIFLPNEPFLFTDDHLQQIRELLAGTPAVQQNRLHLVDGSLITWHGTRLGLALRDLPQYFD